MNRILIIMNEKNTTARIIIDDPIPEDLETHLAGRTLCPHLLNYLKKVVINHKGGARKINIPSTRNDVGVALLGSSSLERTHLQMHDELHVFSARRAVVVKWMVRGENGLCVPEKDFSSLEIKKVQVEGEQVTVILTTPKVDVSIVVDFARYGDKSTVLEIPHPLKERPAL